jgi:protein ImuB
VTPVPGAPGTWWIGATGFAHVGGEAGLLAALRAIARRWHPQARVAIADSCVAARAATWDARPAAAGLVHPLADDACAALVPAGSDAAYLADVPLALLPMDDAVRRTLMALGLGTAGALAALDAGDVEQRWGPAGLGAWRLARGDDPRRPGLVRTDAARTAGADLGTSTTDTEPLLFVLRGALERLVAQCVADGRAVAAVAITCTLDDARGALPDAGARAHTITREVRPARPLARVAPLLELCRGLLARWTLPAPVCALAVSIPATAPLDGRQGDLLDASWRDLAAAEATLARLRAELGARSVVVPEARDAHAPEQAAAWAEAPPLDEPPPRPADAARPATDAEPLEAPVPPLPMPEGAVPRALRLLDPPEPAEVECDAAARPVAVRWRARRIPIRHASGPERLDGAWWQAPYARDYWRCAAAGEPRAEYVVFADRTTRAWYVQGWWD